MTDAERLTDANRERPMSKRRFQFSLRTLFIATSILAVLTAMLANFPSFMIAIALVAFWLLDITWWFSWYFSPLKDFRPLTTTEELRRRKLSEESRD
jgi:hypothetical protein